MCLQKGGPETTVTVTIAVTVAVTAKVSHMDGHEVPETGVHHFRTGM